MEKMESSKRLQHPPYSRFQGYLKENGIKLKDVATVINKNVARISTNNNGMTDYKYDEVMRICKHFNMSEDVFWPREEKN